MYDRSTRAKELSAEFLMQILDSLPTPIWAKDAEGRFVYSNRKNNEIFGRTEKDLLGKSEDAFYLQAQIAQSVENDRRVIKSGSICSVEENVTLPDGRELPVLSRKVRMVTPKGEAFLLGINFSLIEVKKREEQYQALAETVPVGVVQIEEGGAISFINPLMHEYFGGDAQELDRLVAALGKPANFPGEAARFECALTDKAGEERRVLVISSGWLALFKNKTRSAIVSIIDISENAELKRINEEILRLNQELASSMQKLKDAQDALVKKGRLEQMGQLTATIAHELRNPLGAVRTSVFLVERKLKDKGLGIESQLQRINNGVTRCDGIITQLLDFSRTKKLDCRSADLDQWLVHLIEEEVRRLAGCINVACYLGLDGVEVPFDPARLERAIANLISNASEAMVGNGDQPLPDMSEEPTITITTRRVGDLAEIEIADNGPGIAPETLEKVREPLFTTKSFGTGLGIPAVEQIAIQHGGMLDIQSDPGKGARFILRLPFVQADSEVEAA
jgi:PAS domain S-box-containing protein